MRQTADNLFKPVRSQAETKTDTTTRIAGEIIDKEAADRAAKTERLRAARLARDAEAAPAVKKAVRKRK